MPLTSLGDMSSLFISRRHNLQLRTDLQRLTTELSTGRKEDLPAALGGQTPRLTDLMRRIGLAETGLAAARETGDRLALMQEGLDRVEGLRSDLVARLLPVSAESGPARIALAATVATDGLADVVSALGVSIAGQSLFSGRATDTPALAPAAAMLADLTALVAGETTAAGVVAAVDAWFDTPGGGFETAGYLGDAGAPLTRPLDGERQVTVEPRADAPALREVMKAAALAAMAAPGVTSLGERDRAEVIRAASDRLLSAAEPLATLRAGMGETEARVEEAATRLSGRIAALSAMRNDLAAADPFATASALQEVQTRLETHYVVTARLAALSLVGYLR